MASRPKRLQLMPLRTSILLVLPAFAMFAILVLYPMIATLADSLFRWSGTRRGEFSGVANFVTLLSTSTYRDPLVNALSHNMLLFLGALVFQNSVGMLMAVLLERSGRLRRLFQTLFTLPYLVSSMVIGYLWSLLLSPLFGPVNAILNGVGLESLALPWLGDPTLALWSVVLISAWQWLGFPILLYGAALAGIPAELGEAAQMDGAGPVRSFFHITMPMLLPNITTVTVLTFIGAVESLAIPYAIGGSTGSPAGATDVLMLVFYRTGFESGSENAFGMAAAVAVLIFAFIMAVSMVLVRSARALERRVL